MPGKEIQNWVDPAMYAAEPMEDVQPRVYLLSATPDPLGAIAAACMIYEGKVCRDPRELTDDQRRYYWGEVQKTHLTAPLEYVDFHFLIEGVTRAFTHQLVRQRTAVFAQESMRFAVKDNMVDEVPIPPGFRDGSWSEEEREWGEGLWKVTIKEIQKTYDALINKGLPNEDARGILPHATTTRIHYKTNLRNLADHAGNRLCTQAQFEWKVVFYEIVKAISEGIGLQYGCKPDPERHGKTVKRLWTPSKWQFEVIAESNLFRPVCYAKGKCPFNADFDRGCTIRPRVEEGKFDEIDTSEWMLDPAAARRG